jgi:hypothetical protein
MGGIRKPKPEGRIASSGYRMHKVGGSRGRYVREHILIVERALGRALRGTECVHHANGKRADNRPENLVVCPSQAYHSLLHQRMRARAASVPLDWRLCSYCHSWDHPSNLSIRWHRRCHAEYERRRRVSTLRENPFR